MKERATDPRPCGGPNSLPRSIGEVRFWSAAVAFVVTAAVWCYVDVAPRGRIEPGRIEMHRTDFSVYTTAAAAFFDGREPYAVTNPRGWSYLYPPIFAITVAPLSRLDPVSQVVVWFAVSLIACFGVFAESFRIWRIIGPGGKASEGLGLWVAASAVLTVLFPTLECLQRGQVGVVILYALLLGMRLVLEGRGRGSWFLGGLVLAWPVAVKLIPALPVGFLVWQRGALAFTTAGPSRRDAGRAGALGIGALAGAALFLVLIPAAFLGWDANLRHLATWTRKVVTNPDAGNEAKFHIDSTSNQSFTNAAHRLATALRGTRPDDPEPTLLKSARNEGEVRWALDRAFAERRKADTTTRRVVLVAQALMAFLLFVVGTTPRRDDPVGQVAGFGLACVGMLLLSPVAWSHYFMVMIPAVLAVPLWLDLRGQPSAARASAAAPAALVLGHFLAKSWVGPLGLLGLGITAWFLAVAAAMAVAQVFPTGRPGFYRPGFARFRRVRETHESSS